MNNKISLWVSDALHDLIGFSDDATVHFIISLSQAHKNPVDFAAALIETASFPSSRRRDVIRFAEEFWKRLEPSSETVRPKKQDDAEQYREKVRERKRIEKTYSLIIRDEDVVVKSSSKEAVAGNKRQGKDPASSSRSSKKRRRREGYSSTRVDDLRDRPAVLDDSYRERKGSLADHPALGQNSDAIARDIIERDAFADRLLERDKMKRRESRLKGFSGTKHDEDGDFSQAEDDATIQRLRELSRRQYLRKREARELEKLREEIEDEEELFKGERLSAREVRNLETKKRLYELASQRVALLRDDEGHNEDAFRFDLDSKSGVAGRYKVPEPYVNEKNFTEEEKRLALLTRRYADHESGQRRAKGEQALWEEQQIRTGARNISAAGSNVTSALKQEAIGSHAEQYELVPDPVEFVDDAEAMLEGEGDTDLAADKAELTNGSVGLDEKERILQERKSLPIWEYRTALVEAIQEYQVLIVVGETGSGKTTQIPQFLIEAGFGRVACTQPRRVAAMSVAARVAHEMGVKLGREVGYSIRFEDCTSESTIIKYMTDGMMLREFLSEPDLERYDVIMIDEAHERSLSTDIVMGLVKDIARFRGPSVRVIISSATMNAEKFSNYFDHAHIFKVPGRRYPVDILYTKAPEADYLDACVVTILQIHQSQPPGDILVFLTGQDDIEIASEALKYRTRGLGTSIGELLILPVFSALPSDLQARVFEPTPAGARKVVLATNIAETSVTIPGIVYVIDAGFSKQKTYNPKSGLESLMVHPISQAGATQRTGRAGRTQPGKCFRLYTKQAFEKELPPQPTPEILRTNLCQVILLLLSLGITNLVSFDFIDPPPSSTLIGSLERLYSLGALNSQGSLTKLGRRMAELPLSPEMAKSLLASERYGSSSETATIAAMLSVNSTIFYRPRNKKTLADAAIQSLARIGGGDFGLLLAAYNGWVDSGFSTQWCKDNFVQARAMKRARDIREQLVTLMDRVEIEECSAGGEMDAILRAFTAGFFEQSIRLHKTGYKTVRKPHLVKIHPSSVLSKTDRVIKWMIYFELVQTTKEYVRTVAEVKVDWLIEAAPHLYSDAQNDKGKKG